MNFKIKFPEFNVDVRRHNAPLTHSFTEYAQQYPLYATEALYNLHAHLRVYHGWRALRLQALPELECYALLGRSPQAKRDDVCLAVPPHARITPAYLSALFELVRPHLQVDVGAGIDPVAMSAPSFEALGDEPSVVLCVADSDSSFSLLRVRVGLTLRKFELADGSLNSAKSASSSSVSAASLRLD